MSESARHLFGVVHFVYVQHHVYACYWMRDEKLAERKWFRKSIVAALLQRRKYGNILFACMFNVELILEECSLESDNCQGK
jgi:hypothetical protein